MDAQVWVCWIFP